MSKYWAVIQQNTTFATKLTIFGPYGKREAERVANQIAGLTHVVYIGPKNEHGAPSEAHPFEQPTDYPFITEGEIGND